MAAGKRAKILIMRNRVVSCGIITINDANIASIEEISDLAFKLKIRDSDYNEIDNPEIQVSILK